ncbi:protein Spindly-B-like isoform X3 [Acipenser oxyrinchus oxyrinchus]|uniref:Protein Spindly n=1 Tax=Acipenser oxyrinchus oxyrinchus TaxID=40147 RepID=A0AAD8FVS4_ACIOX|nr:protein Spindly-B-like isoform X3 [Acipenser oxyrinchus oxyrinchus]
MSTAEVSETQRLRFKLKEAEEALEKAAQYGLQLLESQHELQNQLEEQRAEMTNTIEALEQEKYSLQREVELKVRMLESMGSECDTIKQQQKLLWEQQEAMQERNHAWEISDFKNKLEKMKAELDEARLSDRQLRHKLELQSEMLSSKSEELRALSERAHETMSSEVLGLQIDKTELEAARDLLEHEINEMKYRQQQLELTNTNLQRQVERLSEEKEEREREAISYFNSLEKTREACQDLQIQLDHALQQGQDPNSKGNSLFSEVEDRRAEMERQLISMKVQYQSLQKQHAFSRQQLHRMKIQIATLLQLKGCQADPEQLERLQAMLGQKNNEIEVLMIKLRQLEKLEVTHKAELSCASAGEQVYGDGTYYTDLLKMQLTASKQESDRLGDELSLQRMKALAESQRVLEVERKLFGSERALKLCQGENMKLRVRLDELRMKYEPDAVNKDRVQKRRREKLPVDMPADEPTEKGPGKHQPAVNGEAGQIEPSATLLQEVPAPEPASQLPRETKRVRISEEPPRSVPVDLKIKKEEEEEVEIGAENSRAERKSRQRAHPVIHVSSKPTSENQCAQQ